MVINIFCSFDLTFHFISINISTFLDTTIVKRNTWGVWNNRTLIWKETANLVTSKSVLVKFWFMMFQSKASSIFCFEFFISSTLFSSSSNFSIFSTSPPDNITSVLRHIISKRLKSFKYTPRVMWSPGTHTWIEFEKWQTITN